MHDGDHAISMDGWGIDPGGGCAIAVARVRWAQAATDGDELSTRGGGSPGMAEQIRAKKREDGLSPHALRQRLSFRDTWPQRLGKSLKHFLSFRFVYDSRASL